MRTAAFRGLAILLAALLSLSAHGAAVAAASESANPTTPVTLVLFHGEGCPHCAAERDFLMQLRQEYPDLVVEEHEVWNDAENLALLEATATRLGFEATGVPVTVIGERVWIGFNAEVSEQITAVVAAGLSGPQDAVTPPPPPKAGGPEGSPSVDLPWVGSVDLSSSSLLVATVVIGFADGVNPCSLWVLSLLLAMVLSRGSRGRVMIVGSTFLAVTATMYALYIVGFYSALDYMGSLSWIRFAVATVAITFGLLQLKDGVRPDAGPSLSIAPSARPALYARMRAVASPDGRVSATLVGTIALAIGVSLIETPCTAGLPLLWTSLLVERGVTMGAAVALFAVYMSVFLLDELVVFGIAVVTLRGGRLQERHGRALKIIAGSVLVTLGLTMLTAPEAMDSLAGTMLVFTIAAGLSLVISLLVIARAHRQQPSR